MAQILLLANAADPWLPSGLPMALAGRGHRVHCPALLCLEDYYRACRTDSIERAGCDIIILSGIDMANPALFHKIHEIYNGHTAMPRLLAYETSLEMHRFRPTNSRMTSQTGTVEALCDTVDLLLRVPAVALQATAVVEPSSRPPYCPGWAVAGLAPGGRR